jgi:histidinol dehydrogenase
VTIAMRIIDLTRGDEIDSGVGATPVDPSIATQVAAICDDVRERGDAALVDLTRRFDGVDVDGRIRVSEAEIAGASDALEQDIAGILDRLAARLAVFCGHQRLADWELVRGGVRFGERVRPIRAVGAYAPGGRALYPSTVIMTTVPAVAAGVERIALASPPTSDGDVAAEFLHAARTVGVHDVYRVGGAQAVAALAYGTESVKAVDKIVGPGNAWVTAAKRHVAGTVGIDGLAGPSDATVLSDGRTDPVLVAAELVAQAEHDPDSRAFLVTTERDHAERVLAEVGRQAAATPRTAIVSEALTSSAIVLVGSLDEALATVDRLAPEHLLILADDPDAILAQAGAFGAAFLGELTSVVFGDYGGTSNHVLPTMGTARFSSGLRTADFQVAASFVEMSVSAVRDTATDIEMLAHREGLHGHAAAIELRRRRVEEVKR